MARKLMNHSGGRKLAVVACGIIRNMTAILAVFMLPLLLLARGLWQVFPNPYWCAAFWLIFCAHHILNTRKRWQYLPGVCGGLLNAVVTISNGGRMPVLNMRVGDQSSVWREARPTDHFLPLCDRLLWGFSVGDVIIIAGLLLPLAVWLSRKALDSAPAMRLREHFAQQQVAATVLS